MTYTSKSKRINSIDDDYTIECMNGVSGRWARAWYEYWPEYDDDSGDETGTRKVYRFVAGTTMMPNDYSVEYETLRDLEETVREFADLRKWRHDGAW